MPCRHRRRRRADDAELSANFQAGLKMIKAVAGEAKGGCPSFPVDVRNSQRALRLRYVQMHRDMHTTPRRG